MKNIEDLLDDISVFPPGMWKNDIKGIEDWHAVANDQGIIAYFSREEDAFMFRLDYINRILNG